MIAVTIQPHLAKPRWMTIYLGDEPWRDVAAILVKDRSLCASYVSLHAWEKTWAEWESKKIKALSISKLSRKRYFADELKQALSSYGLTPSLVNDRVEILVKEGYLDDQDGVESLIRRAIRQGKGPQWIEQFLRQKGVGQQDLRLLIEKNYPLPLREEKIALLLKKKPKEKHKAIAFVARRGFSLEEVLRVYSRRDSGF